MSYFLQAISSLRKAIWLSPLNYNALYNLSLIYITGKLYEYYAFYIDRTTKIILY